MLLRAFAYQHCCRANLLTNFMTANPRYGPLIIIFHSISRRLTLLFCKYFFRIKYGFCCHLGLRLNLAFICSLWQFMPSCKSLCSMFLFSGQVAIKPLWKLHNSKTIRDLLAAKAQVARTPDFFWLSNDIKLRVLVKNTLKIFYVSCSRFKDHVVFTCSMMNMCDPVV